MVDLKKSRILWQYYTTNMAYEKYKDVMFLKKRNENKPFTKS